MMRTRFSFLVAWLPPARTNWILYAICVICTVVEFLLQLGDYGLLALPRMRQVAYEYAAFWPGLMGPWHPNYAMQPYVMFVTYAFLHGGLLHLIFNMLTLLSLGGAVTHRVHQIKFLFIFTASVIGGGLFYGFLTNAPNPMVGASGGIFGLAGSLLAWNYVDRFSAGRRLWPVLRAVLGLGVLNLVLWWLMDGHLAWETHLGGFVAGWCAALLADPRGYDIPNSSSP